MLRIVPHTVPRVGRSYEHFPDGFEVHLRLERTYDCSYGYPHRSLVAQLPEREFFIDNLMVRIHLIIVMILVDLRLGIFEFPFQVASCLPS